MKISIEDAVYDRLNRIPPLGLVAEPAFPAKAGPKPAVFTALVVKYQSTYQNIFLITS